MEKVFLQQISWLHYMLLITGCFIISGKQYEQSEQIIDTDNKSIFMNFEHQPYFDTTISQNVTTIVGDIGILNCRINNLGNKSVVWVRHRDIHLLTVGKFTYTSDQRFRCTYDPEVNIWSLHIQYTQKRDSGIYECQIGTTPPVGIPLYLSVVEPITTILGAKDLYINIGSTINLTCIVQNLPFPPSYIIWTHNNEEINFDSSRGGVSVITEKGEITTSYLYVQRAKHSDTGIYTCRPSNASPFAVNIHVVKEEQSAAIQYIDSGQQKTFLHKTFSIYFFLLSIKYLLL